MKKKISILTIVLALLFVYLIGLSCLEYYAYIQSKQLSDTIFEMGQNSSSASLMKMFNQTFTSIESNEWKIAQAEDRIVNIQNEVANNWYMNTYFNWLIRAKMHFYMAFLAILMTILSWKFDNLNRK